MLCEIQVSEWQATSTWRSEYTITMRLSVLVSKDDHQDKWEIREMGTVGSCSKLAPGAADAMQEVLAMNLHMTVICVRDDGTEERQSR